jgi:hypothetical protein
MVGNWGVGVGSKLDGHFWKVPKRLSIAPFA